MGDVRSHDACVPEAVRSALAKVAPEALARLDAYRPFISRFTPAEIAAIKADAVALPEIAGNPAAVMKRVR